jgi:DNA-binding transcriptional ArsR family regulator
MRTLKIFTDQKAFEIAADKTRRRIVHLLRARVLSVSQIADELDMTPQAIYHHIRKMLEVGLIEVAKEERIEHFIETYYQTSAEIFQFNYGEENDRKFSEARTRESLVALNKIGLLQPIDDETVAKFSKIQAKINSIHQMCSLDSMEKVSNIEGLDSFTKQDAIEIGCKISMSDRDYEEIQRLNLEIRELLRSNLVLRE